MYKGGMLDVQRGECWMYKGGMLDVHTPLKNPVKSRLFSPAKNPILINTS